MRIDKGKATWTINCFEFMARACIFAKKVVILHSQSGNKIAFGSLAQLNRASDYGSEGYRFESYTSHKVLLQSESPEVLQDMQYLRFLCFRGVLKTKTFEIF